MGDSRLWHLSNWIEEPDGVTYTNLDDRIMRLYDDFIDLVEKHGLSTGGSIHPWPNREQLCFCQTPPAEDGKEGEDG